MSFTREQSATMPLMQMHPSLYCCFLYGKATQASLHGWFLDNFSGNLLFSSHLYNTTLSLFSSLALLWRSWVPPHQQRDGLQCGQKVPREGKGDQRMKLCLLEEDTGKKEGELVQHAGTKTRRVQG